MDQMKLPKKTKQIIKAVDKFLDPRKRTVLYEIYIVIRFLITFEQLTTYL